MTPEEFTGLISNLRVMVDNVRDKVGILSGLVERVERLIDRSDPLSLPLSQEEVDHIVLVYSPLYIAALTAVEESTDNLGSDILH